MRSSLFLAALAAANGVLASLIPSNDYYYRSSPELTSYINSLVPVAKDVLLHKIAGRALGPGVDPAVLITVMPEDNRPDYLIYWVRDACFAYYAWLAELEIAGNTDVALREYADDFVHILVRTQHAYNPSGTTLTGGLEEALFDLHIRKFIYPAEWRIGSPAADGPPLRAIVLLKYAEWLLQPEQNNGTWVADVLWPAINLDLQWIGQRWNTSSWDLWWSPVWGGSYWTASMQYRALKAGARVAQLIGRESDDLGYDGIAKSVLDYMQTFWNEKEGFMTETTITDVKTGGRSGVGAAPMTVSILNFDPTLGCDPLTFQPCSDRALSNLKVVGDKFTEIYPINQKLPPNQFPYVGFFLEDKLYNGQVQYFASINVAEQIFDALLTWDLIGKLEVTKVSLKFFRQIDKTIKIGKYSKGSRTYDQLTTTIRDWAENTLLSLRPRTPPDLILPLVMNNRTGEPMLPPIGPNGALRSQVAVLGIHNSYNGVIPPSWANGYPTRKPKNPWGRKPGHGSKHCDGSSDFEDQYAFDYGYE